MFFRRVSVQALDFLSEIIYFLDLSSLIVRGKSASHAFAVYTLKQRQAGYFVG
jgi:hypothetical protein